uniref:Transmembrane protein 100 n=1 Tax=Paramormyrops kingsleyae TaxID=1676925 RepID=A0A3B3RAA4_9TELE
MTEEKTMSNCSLSERPPSTVIFDTRSEAVILPDGVVSVAGITVVTGGAELTCGSCLLAFGVWGTLIGVSVVLLGIWDQKAEKHGVSTLLALGLVILSLSLAMVLGVKKVKKKKTCACLLLNRVKLMIRLLLLLNVMLDNVSDKQTVLYPSNILSLICFSK